MIKPHFPALCRMSDGMPILTNQLYPDVESAKKDLGATVLRLATEYPPVLVEAREIRSPEEREKAARDAAWNQAQAKRNEKPAPTKVPSKGQGFNWNTGKRNG